MSPQQDHWPPWLVVLVMLCVFALVIVLLASLSSLYGGETGG